MQPTGWVAPLQDPCTSHVAPTRDMGQGVPQQAQGGQQGTPQQAPWKRSLSLSGQVLPPLTLLLQRALDLEARLLGPGK
jgi:hypothetical protein